MKSVQVHVILVTVNAVSYLLELEFVVTHIGQVMLPKILLQTYSSEQKDKRICECLMFISGHRNLCRVGPTSSL